MPAPRLPPETATGAVVETALTEALPVPDMVFGGSMLVLVITVSCLLDLHHRQLLEAARGAKGPQRAVARGPVVRRHRGGAALLLLAIFVWTVGLVGGNIVDSWAKASYFAANCYTALGEPFSCRCTAPIIAVPACHRAWCQRAGELCRALQRRRDLARREKALEGAKQSVAQRYAEHHAHATAHKPFSGGAPCGTVKFSLTHSADLRNCHVEGRDRSSEPTWAPVAHHAQA